jgi:class 3 adenylate cyclase
MATDATAHEHIFKPTKAKLKKFLNAGDVDENGAAVTAPIADLFTECTVMFADIAGFTAWSSVRDPCQVFTLLEAVYGAFDAIAAKRGVFKVEVSILNIACMRP